MRRNPDLARVPLLQRPYCFLDIETTGLKAGWNELTEIGIEHEKFGSWSCRIKPRYMDRAHPDALAMQGYNPTDWEDAPDFADVAPKIVEWTEDTIIVGHNISGFDIPMIRGNFEIVELSSYAIPREHMDTMTLAIEHLVPKGLKTLSLKAICDFLKISNEGAHTALTDAIRVRHFLRQPRITDTGGIPPGGAG